MKLEVTAMSGRDGSEYSMIVLHDRNAMHIECVINTRYMSDWREVTRFSVPAALIKDLCTVMAPWLEKEVTRES